MDDEQTVDDLMKDTVFTPPDGVLVKRGSYGLSLHASRPIPAGGVIYRADEIRVPDDGRIYRTQLLVDGQETQVDITPMHTVRYQGGRTFDIPGCFMNHSCDPSSVSRDVMGPTGVIGYEQVAIRDLAPGDEITCDYTLFDWDCDGHQFTCACGSENCYGFIGGFASLPREVQQRLAHAAYYEAERMWNLTRYGA